MDLGSIPSLCLLICWQSTGSMYIVFYDVTGRRHVGLVRHFKTCSAAHGFLGTTCKPDRAPLKEVLGGQFSYREGERQVLRQGAKGCRISRKCQCSKDPCA